MTKPAREGQSSAKFLRKNQLMRKLDKYRNQGGPSRDFPMAVEALLDFVNDKEVSKAWYDGLPKDQD
jgi:hypothetical protein